MISLREFANQSVGVSGDFSVVRDFFGHREGQPRMSSASPGRQLSVLDLVHQLQGDHIHLDIIQVGGDQFLPGHKRDIDFAVFSTRDIFAQVGLGVGRVTHHLMTTAEADGLHQIDTKSQGKKLARRNRGSNDDAIDVFVVLDFNVEVDGEPKAGFARINLPCNKDVYHFDAIVMGVRSSGGVNTGAVQMGILLAHELGHGLGLEHVETVGNLMFKTSTGSALSANQGNEMRGHCFVQSGV